MYITLMLLMFSRVLWGISNMVLWYHYIGDFANVFKSFVGTNYLACAYGFKISGLGVSVPFLIHVIVLQ